MTTEIQAETTEQPVLEAEQSQEAVSSAEEATVQESQAQETESRSKTPEWVQRRFNEMTRDKHEAQRKADALAAEVETYRQLMAARGEDGEQTQQPAVKAPVNDETRIQEAARRLNETERFNARSNEVYGAGTKEYADFDSALSNLGMLGASPEFFQSIVGLDDAHKVLHALGSNPDEASRILALTPLQQGRELERLANKSAKPAAKKPPVSKAPEPISTVVDGTSSTPVDLDKASIDDFMKARNSQSRRR
ncbi:hypothetical protein D3C80_1114910 [compost metagenome]